MKIPVFAPASILFLAITVLVLGGCANDPVVKPGTYTSPVQHILSGTALLGRAYEPAQLPNDDLFAVTPDMVKFAEHIVRGQNSYFDKVRALHVALLSSRESGGYGLVYNAYRTEVPSVTFQQRRANCLSFTLLYVALARQVGIRAEVNEVQIPPTWDLRNKDDMVFLRHVNVKVPMRESINILRNDDVIIDLEMNRYSPNYDQHEIDDDLIAAEFYSNRAMEYLTDNDMRNAFLSLRKAIAMNDQQSYIWSNLGALYGRNKLYAEAETAYLHGLEINPEDLTIMNNLAYLYQHSGNKAGEVKYVSLAHRYRESNPYYQYTLAQAAFASGELELALQFIKRAIDRDKFKKEMRFFQLAADIYDKQANNVMQNEMLKKVMKLKP